MISKLKRTFSISSFLLVIFSSSFSFAEDNKKDRDPASKSCLKFEKLTLCGGDEGWAFKKGTFGGFKPEDDATVRVVIKKVEEKQLLVQEKQENGHEFTISVDQFGSTDACISTRNVSKLCAGTKGEHLDLPQGFLKKTAKHGPPELYAAVLAIFVNGDIMTDGCGQWCEYKYIKYATLDKLLKRTLTFKE